MRKPYQELLVFALELADSGVKDERGVIGNVPGGQERVLRMAFHAGLGSAVVTGHRRSP